MTDDEKRERLKYIKNRLQDDFADLPDDVVPKVPYCVKDRNWLVKVLEEELDTKSIQNKEFIWAVLNEFDGDSQPDEIATDSILRIARDQLVEINRLNKELEQTKASLSHYKDMYYASKGL